MNLIKTYGDNSWVLVSGATDGIGKSFCEEFAKMGFNVILVSRTQEKLDNVASELKKLNPKISTKTVKFDFNMQDSLNDYLDTFADIVNKFDVSILVNNVGIATPKRFERFELEECKEMINLNLLAQTMLTRIFIPKLMNRQPRAAVISLSSCFSLHPFPVSQLYNSSKRYNDFLSRGLNEEFKKNVDFLSVLPMFVETNSSKMKSNGFVVTPKKCVNGALDDLGYENQTYGAFSHKIQGYLITLIPEWVISNFSGLVFGRKVYKKGEKSEKKQQ